MNKNYLSSEEETILTRYSSNASYIVENYQDSSAGYYQFLSEDYDVLKNIDKSLLSLGETKQSQLIFLCFSYLQTLLFSLYKNQKIEVVLPKFTAIKDLNNTISFFWAYSTFRASLIFEGEKGEFDAYCTIVFQTDVTAISSKSQKLTDENYKSIIEDLLSIVLNNL